MSRRSSNTVALARRRRSKHATPLDRNGLPILDPPHEANRLPKRCAGLHTFVRVGRRFVKFDEIDRAIYEVESRCVMCGERSVETEAE